MLQILFLKFLYYLKSLYFQNKGNFKLISKNEQYVKFLYAFGPTNFYRIFSEIDELLDFNENMSTNIVNNVVS